MSVSGRFYLLLMVWVVGVAWLLAHPNSLGKFGIWFYHYDYLRTFPRALATVGFSTLCVAGVSELIWRFFSPVFAKVVYIVLLIIGIFIVLQTAQQFLSGMYAHTGISFRTGAVLLPVLYVLVLGYGLWQAVGRKKKNA